MISPSNPDTAKNSKSKILRSSFEFFWRVSIIALPWQTRWFSDASLGGYPFEQGRVSFYVSWIPLIITIVIGLFLPRTTLPKKIGQSLFWLFVLLGGITIVGAPLDIRASAMWWIQIFLLSAFFITLFRSKIPLKSLLTWFVFSLVPHAIFAIAQVYLQYIPAIKWLGSAMQNPANLGVSVVQSASARYLRAYGGFPHPNIFGGFMAVATLSSIWLYGQYSLGASAKTNAWLKIAFLSFIPLFTAALFYSFSRSAWLALAAGLLAYYLPSLARRGNELRSLGWSNNIRRFLPLLGILIIFFALAAIHWDLAATRLGLAVEPARLEQISTSARTSSLKDGVLILQAYPIFGTGPNAELSALYQINNIQDTARGTRHVGRGNMPLESPHNVFLLVLVNFGVAGALIIFGFLLFLLRQILKHWQRNNPGARDLALSLLSALIIISLFDHYPWSYWSGQYLSLFIFFMVIFWLDYKDDRQTPSS